MQSCRIAATTSLNFRPFSTVPALDNSRSTILALLHKTTELLPRVLPSWTSESTSFEQSLSVWNGVLSDSYNNLASNAKDVPLNVTVLELDQWSGAKDLVTGLLQEPFASDASGNNLISQRWNDVPPGQASLTILSGDPAMRESHLFPCKSSYFHQYPTRIQIQEFPHINSPQSKNHSGNEQHLRAFLQADIPVIVCNPFTTSPRDVLANKLFLTNPHTIFVFTYVSSSVPEPDCLYRRYLSDDNRINALFVDPARALSALDALRANPKSPSAIQRYQDEFIGSGTLTLTRTIKRIMSATGKASSADISAALRTETCLSHIRSALAIASDLIRLETTKSDVLFVQVSALRERIEEERIKASREVFGVMSPEDEITGAAQKEISSEMGRLSWWRMIPRVDEITTTVSTAVGRSGRNLEKKLIYHAGRLSHTQQTFSDAIFALFPRSTSSLHSSVLHNTLLQMRSTSYYPLTPDSLVGPLAIRHAQIIQYPTARLHLAGQRVVLGMGSSIVAGVSMGWAGWLKWLIGGSESVIEFLGVDVGTAMGAGALITLLGVRWGVGHWEKAKQRWWEDWHRVVDGLERDLKKTLDNIVLEKVVAVADKGCSGLSALIEKRNQEIGEVAEELAKLSDDLKSIDSRCKGNL
ncbi:uncharacterized protein BT62DRAFT_1075912 [Guyanagaster necrorhizus]|uniref:Uncharacterized protein n=1 Tax=Guyanagaster necrorhizus TaxID=856835 RepID=A0A9P8ATY2_9AGAR|nr:uncharacterized protein BT62DRAFT_1075912 [Guyanagaster necrorhizus MCA 3950]KAG7446332.1 hypothetical protein BT62DRAFT_1075912 [Guyanagaster necrorhizus MCA 3950]